MLDLKDDPLPADEDLQVAEPVLEDETIEDADGATDDDEDLSEDEPVA